MIWQSIRDVSAFGDANAVVRLSLKPSDFPALIAGDLAETPAAGHRFLLDWGGGLAWLAADAEPVAGFLQRHQARCAQVCGHATLIKGDVEGPYFQPESAGIAALTAGLRAKFDPRGLLNPRLMG
jgi:glycolate oxidase FAD binding subunit